MLEMRVSGILLHISSLPSRFGIGDLGDGAYRFADGVYFEAASVIVVLISLGQVLELRARSRTGAAIKALLGLAPVGDFSGEGKRASLGGSHC